MLHAIVGLLDNSAHIDSFVSWPDTHTASNKHARNRSGHTRQDSLCTYTVEDFKFLDTLVHIYVCVMTIHRHKTIIYNDSTHCERMTNYGFTHVNFVKKVAYIRFFCSMACENF